MITIANIKVQKFLKNYFNFKETDYNQITLDGDEIIFNESEVFKIEYYTANILDYHMFVNIKLLEGYSLMITIYYEQTDIKVRDTKNFN